MCSPQKDNKEGEEITLTLPTAKSVSLSTYVSKGCTPAPSPSPFLAEHRESSHPPGCSSSLTDESL